MSRFEHEQSLTVFEHELSLAVFEHEQSLAVKELSPIQNISCELSSSNNTLNKELNIGKGDKGEKGEKGDDGYTPQKGVDYFTREDIDSLKDIFSQVEHTHYNKIDNVELDGSILNFYAEGIIVKSIEISKRAVAICGEFLSGEVFVGEGVETLASKTQPKWVDGVTPVNAKNMNEIEDKLRACEIALNELYIGENPPQDSVVWIDTSSVDVLKPITDDALSEIKNTFIFLQEQINILILKNNELENRVYYLETNTSTGGSSGKGILLVNEDGDILICEEDSVLIFEEGVM